VRLVGVGVGPGDPELVTVKAVRVMGEADVVLVPVLAGDEPGRAEATVRCHVDDDRIRRVVFALNERTDAARRESAWDAAGAEVLAAFDAGAHTVAFATIGDPNVYSTFTYLAATVRAQRPGVAVETVPGITALQDLAARSGTVLCEGTETLALCPITAGPATLRAALAGFDTVVAYKGGRRLPETLRLLREAGRLDGAVFGASLGLPGQDIRPAAELAGGSAGHPSGTAPYLSTLIVPARRDGRGGKL
jgi:precorrin-2/cobalt-factor-2 C20-methyltransferase